MKNKSPIDRGFLQFVDAYNQPGFDFNINIARCLVCFFLIWKLLSRDFGFFGTLPNNIVYTYPIQLYPAKSYVLWTGLPILTDLLTFHWVHWILPRPSELVMRLIQGTGIASLVLLAIVGRGPKRSILIFTYIVLIYLWGHIILHGQEIDSVDLYFGMILALGISNYRDEPIWNFRSLYGSPKTAEGGRSFSNLILVLVFYYFASGIKKLTDISLADWFRYDLIGAIEAHTIRAAHSTLATLDIFKFLHGWTVLNDIGPPAVYMSHLLVPTVFFNRNLLIKFFLFYATFHVLTFGVGISFTGYILVWGVLFQYREIIAWTMRRLHARAEAGPEASK